MPVKREEVGAPPATIRFEQPEGPIVVGVPAEDAAKSTGLHEHNPGDETVAADWHDQSNPDVQFEQPGPLTVTLEGFERQTKVVTPAKGKRGTGTSGAAGK